MSSTKIILFLEFNDVDSLFHVNDQDGTYGMGHDPISAIAGMKVTRVFLENENTQLKADNKVLGNELTYFKELCVELEEQVNNLQKGSDCDLCIDCINCSKGLVETSIWSPAGGA